ncbi:hypothetical protein EPR50_G00198750 [Perca flavescens]|uniref:Uncharacterized protein n=1 Tax=Perca flavescens TaxID=8167 RepID=A0A484C7G3_PERFV|nr:hypothetical protein EPR50_G00198750 [Perca flavescens]
MTASSSLPIGRRVSRGPCDTLAARGPKVTCCLLKIQSNFHRCLQILKCCWHGHPGRRNTTWHHDYNRVKS